MRFQASFRMQCRCRCRLGGGPGKQQVINNRPEYDNRPTHDGAFACNCLSARASARARGKMNTIIARYITHRARGPRWTDEPTKTKQQPHCENIARMRLGIAYALAPYSNRSAARGPARERDIGGYVSFVRLPAHTRTVVIAHTRQHAYAIAPRSALRLAPTNNCGVRLVRKLCVGGGARLRAVRWPRFNRISSTAAAAAAVQAMKMRRQ